MKQHSISRSLSVAIGAALCLGLLSLGITRETPVGGIGGAVTMKENGRALPEAFVELRPVMLEKDVDAQWLPTDEHRQVHRIETGKDGTFVLRDVQSGDYEISITTDAHTMRNRYIHIAEGKAARQDFELDPVAPYLTLYSSQHVFTPDEKIEFSMTGFGSGDSIDVAAYRLESDHVLKFGSLYAALAPLASDAYRSQKTKPSESGVRVQSHQPKIVTRDVEGVFNERLRLDSLTEGLYWVEAEFGGHRRGTWFSVSKLALVSKQSGGELTIFATDLVTGAAVQGVQIGYALEGRFRPVASTAANGLATFRIDPNVKESGVLMGLKGESRSFVDLRVSRPQRAQLRTMVYTDRPVYRPGDEVHFKGLVRRLEGSTYSIPTEREVEVEIRDADDSLLQRSTLDVSAMGAFTGSITVNREAKPGSFSIQTSMGDEEGYGSFEVAEYRKPEFSIKVEPLKPYYLKGEQAQLQVECEYFFGGPVQNAEVEAYITRSPTWDYGPLDEEFDDYEEGGEGSYGGEYVVTVKARTDSSGRATITFPTLAAEEGANGFETSDVLYSAQVSVTEGSGKYFDGEGSVKVVRSAVASRVDLDRYVVRPSESFDATIMTYDPVTDAPVPGQEVTVEAGYNVWKGTKSEFVVFAKKVVKTNSQGALVMAITPERGGQLEIHASTTDSGGRTSLSTSYAWVDKRGDWYGDPPTLESELSIRLDKKRYDPGETAKLIIETDKPGATALVTIEADKIYLAKTVKLAGSVTIVDIGVAPEYAPTAFATVTFVREKRFNSRQRRLAVDLSKKKLVVSVEADRADYRPGDLARYTIRTQSETGEPLSANLSLALVDESIYSILEDRTDIVKEFYPKRYNSVDTQFSFEEIYLDGGDKAPKGIQIRKRFKDTAYWKPDVTTGTNGIAQIAIRLPDNLTSWRATAIGMTADTRVGQAKENVRARKPLMVRLEAASFYVQRDSQRVSAMVTNDSGRDGDVQVELSVQNGKLLGSPRQKKRIKNGETARLDWEFSASDTGSAVFTCKAWIDEANSDGIEWRVPVQPFGRLVQETMAGTVEETATFKVTVRDNADIATGRLRIVATPSLASSMAESLDDLIGFPYGCVEQTMSRFLPTVLVSRAVSQAGLPAPRQANQIPQMVSEGLTRLRNMQQSDGSWGWWSYDTGNEFMTGYVLEGLHRAKVAGFEPDEFVVKRATEWAESRLKQSVEAMMEAERRANKGRRSDYYDWIEQRLTKGRIQLIYGLALHKPSASLLSSIPVMKRDEGYAESIGTMALVGKAVGDSSFAARWLGRLRDAGTESGGLLSWSEGWGVEATARGLEAFMAIAPKDLAVPKIVRYLMLKRRGGSWWSTRDTSAALAGLTAYFVQTKEFVSPGTMVVRLNGDVLATIPVSVSVAERPDQIIEVPFSKLRVGENTVQIDRPGAVGYYTADVRQTLVQPTIGAVSEFPGVHVEREYFRLGETLLENGALTVSPSEKNIDSVTEGDLIKVVVTLKTDKPLEYVIVEDPIPSSCRINDRGPVDSADEWSWWWAETIVRDDRAAFFVTKLEPGEHKFTYVVRAESPGLSSALPTLVYNMYDPERRASTASKSLKVQAK